MATQIKEIIAEYKEHDLYTDKAIAHGKQQRKLKLVKEIDEQLQKLGYHMPDKYFHKFAELDNEVVKVDWLNRKLRVFSVDLDHIELDAKYYLKTAKIAKSVADHTTISHSPEMNF